MKRNISSELRLGNLVLVSGRTEEISYIGETECGSINKPCKLSMRHFKYDDVSPIPINKEILTQLGFKPLPHFTVMDSLVLDLGRNRSLSIGCVGNPNEMVFLKEIDVDGRTINDLVCLRNFDYDGYTHVHDIQNIYSSITGKQLKYEA